MLVYVVTEPSLSKKPPRNAAKRVDVAVEAVTKRILSD